MKRADSVRRSVELEVGLSQAIQRGGIVRVERSANLQILERGGKIAILIGKAAARRASRCIVRIEIQRLAEMLGCQL